MWDSCIVISSIPVEVVTVAGEGGVDMAVLSLSVFVRESTAALGSAVSSLEARWALCSAVFSVQAAPILCRKLSSLLLSAISYSVWSFMKLTSLVSIRQRCASSLHCAFVVPSQKQFSKELILSRLGMIRWCCCDAGSPESHRHTFTVVFLSLPSIFSVV
jgi:hypothetical protein